jgi:AraC-like DNA-binding protein
MTSNAKKQILTTDANSLDLATSQLRSELTQLQETAKEIALNPNLSQFFLENNDFSGQAKQELRRYSIANRITSDIFLHYDQSSQLQSSYGTMTTETFLRHKYPNATIKSETLNQALNNMTVPTVLPDREGMNPQFLYFLTPINGSNAQRLGTVLFVIPVMNLTEQLELNVAESKQNIFLFQNGQLLTGTDSNAKFQVIYEKSSEHISTLSLNNEEYFFHRQQVPDTDLVTYSLINKNVLNPLIERIVWTILISLLIFLVIGVIIVMMISYKQYEPIAKLNSLYRKVVSTQEIQLHENQPFLENIGDYLVHQTEQLAYEKVVLQQVEIQKFWQLLLNGSLQDLTIIETEMEKYGEHFSPGNSYMIGVLSTKFASDPLKNMKIKSVLVDYLPINDKHYRVNFVEMPFSETIVFIVQIKSKNETTEISQTIRETMQAFVQTITATNVPIYFGEVVSVINQVDRSYMTALSEKEKNYRPTLLLHAPTVFEQEKVVDPVKVNFQENLILKLLQAVRSGATTTIESLLKELFEQIKIQKLTTPFKRAYLYNIFNQLLFVMNEEGIEIHLDNHFFRSVLTDRESFDLILQLSLKIARYFEESNEEQKEKVNDEIIHYIHQNYTRNNFSLDELAAHFTCSLSYMSRTIKEQTGVTFSKYIQNLRLEAVKQALIETNKPIKEIIQNAGYYDVSNFTRKFKTMTGQTPGNFRKENRVEY